MVTEKVIENAGVKDYGAIRSVARQIPCAVSNHQLRGSMAKDGRNGERQK
jgi:hypothetical protein